MLKLMKMCYIKKDENVQQSTKSNTIKLVIKK